MIYALALSINVNVGLVFWLYLLYGIEDDLPRPSFREVALWPVQAVLGLLLWVLARRGHSAAVIEALNRAHPERPE